jgi:hypothetical protein
LIDEASRLEGAKLHRWIIGRQRGHRASIAVLATVDTMID